MEYGITVTPQEAVYNELVAFKAQPSITEVSGQGIKLYLENNRATVFEIHFSIYFIATDISRVIRISIFKCTCNCIFLGYNLDTYYNLIHDKRVPVTTAWRVLRLRMEERPPVMEGSCEYFE
jgi:hypothetical protein